MTLDATGTRDPDGHTLTFSWFFYPEAGTGIPSRPVAIRPRRTEGGVAAGAGGIPPADAGGPREPPPRVVVQNARESKATVVPQVAGVAHVILAVDDAGTPSLTPVPPRHRGHQADPLTRTRMI